MSMYVTSSSIWKNPRLRFNREAILKWVLMHGVDPKNVESFRIKGRKVIFTEYVRDDKGEMNFSGRRVNTTKTVVDLRERFPVLTDPDSVLEDLGRTGGPVVE